MLHIGIVPSKLVGIDLYSLDNIEVVYIYVWSTLKKIDKIKNISFQFISLLFKGLLTLSFSKTSVNTCVLLISICIQFSDIVFILLTTY